MSETCPCGQPLHYTRLDLQHIMERLVADLGPLIDIQIGARTYKVPRHYIALHGLKALELPALALKYGWESSVNSSR